MKHTDTQGLLIVISAPSGAGKTTICKGLLDEFPDLRFSVSCTTRPPRKGEKDGEDYHFISVKDFKGRIEKGEFVEWEEIYGHFYGTSKKDLENLIQKGHDIILDIDTKGAGNVRARYPEGVFVFIMPPSVEILRERLKKRGSETDDIIKMRFDRAMEEMLENEWYDYVIFNDILCNSVDVMRSVYIAEKNRKSRLQARIDNFYRTTGGI
ncbi:MAG: guanylate kinase [Deltaproteobacteria bacterium]|nr:guanylate kinase [Deltaproteobacteria bacterium]MBW2649910.1 guanylate kinase [Deltaproteobacteria bacterium]